MFYLLLILSFFILSCQTSEDVKIISITHSEIFNDEEEIGTPRDIMVNDSLVIVVDKYTPFIIYDRRTSEHLANKGEYGSGPLEFNRIEQLTSYKNKLYTYDMMKSMLYEVFFLIEDTVCYSIRPIWEEQLYNTTTVLPNCDNKFLCLGIYEDNQIKLMDDKGCVMESLFEYPYRDENEKKLSNLNRFLAYQGCAVNSPNGTNFIHACSSCNYITAFSMIDSKLHKKEKINSYPTYKIENKEDLHSTPFSAHSPMGYMDVSATDEYIYLLYSGKSYAKHNNDVFCGNIVKIYNWDLEYICELHLDLSTYNICATEDNQLLYTVSLAPDYKVVKYEIPQL